MARKTHIIRSSTAEYFAKNLQQVGFSSPVKAVLTTVKEAVDNALDACESAKILPEVMVSVRKIGTGSQKNTDLIEIIVQDNGPGLNQEDLTKVFGEYLASSKFGQGQCSRGQQGIGISAATTWAQLTNARGVVVTSKTKTMRKAIQATVNVNIKGNKGILKNKKSVQWPVLSGLKVEFRIDGRAQLNGDGGLLTYLEATALLNPHLTLKYKLMDKEEVVTERVSDIVPIIPPPTDPHPHTMKLGEFITHVHLYPNITLNKLLTSAFSRIDETSIKGFISNGLTKKILGTKTQQISQEQLKKIYAAIQKTELKPPGTQSVLTIGEQSLAKSIDRMGEIDFFSVVTRKPRICDFKPVVVEVAIARFIIKGDSEEAVRVLRFANRVPLQFDKGNCAITKAIESVNWRSYGLTQPKSTVPRGPYVFAVSVVSPFIKFKNASKETIDASDELVDEIRLSLMQAGQRLSKHIKREAKAAELERKRKHIEKFGPILVDGLARIVGAGQKRKDSATIGLEKILGRDTKQLNQALTEAEQKLIDLKNKQVDLIENQIENIELKARTKLTQKSKAVKSKRSPKGQPRKVSKKTLPEKKLKKKSNIKKSKLSTFKKAPKKKL